MHAEIHEGKPGQGPRVPTRHLRALAKRGELELTVRGESMVPSLEPGDRIRIAWRRVLLPGDVIAFENSDGRVLVHRVLGPRPSRGSLAWMTRADATGQVDPPVPVDRVIGRVVAINEVKSAARISLPDRFSSLALYSRRLGRALARRFR